MSPHLVPADVEPTQLSLSRHPTAFARSVYLKLRARFISKRKTLLPQGHVHHICCLLPKLSHGNNPNQLEIIWIPEFLESLIYFSNREIDCIARLRFSPTSGMKIILIFALTAPEVSRVNWPWNCQTPTHGLDRHWLPVTIQNMYDAAPLRTPCRICSKKSLFSSLLVAG